MDAQKVDMFLMTQGKNFPEEFIPTIRERLLQVSDDKAVMLSTMQFKDPTIVLILSIFLGSFGIDRFFIGDMGLGIGKLLTGGGCGVWTIVDWFLIMGATKQKNYEKLVMVMTI